MGNSHHTNRQAANQQQQDARTLFQADLPKFILQSKIGNGKFMKSYNVRVDGVPLVVKIYMKLSEEDLQSVANRLSFIWKTLSPSRFPNMLPYQMWISRAVRQKNVLAPVYLIRQYIHSNLHDRLSTRPFLNELEKLWLVYQLFKCVEVAHSHRIFHGDIKPENALCTTWNWLMLTDFGTFKPTLIPDDDPTCFQYYFDVMGRSCCYLAPERFYASNVTENNSASISARQLESEWDDVIAGGSRWNDYAAMDIFSLGCSMAEIFLDGKSFIDLPDMLQYLQASQEGLRERAERIDQVDCRSRGLLNNIDNKLVRDVIIDMTQRDPNNRSSVQSYRYILEGRRSPNKMATYQQNLENNSCDDAATDDPSLRPNILSPLPPGPPVPTPLSSKLHAQQMNNIQQSSPFPSYFSKIMHPLFQKLHVRGVTPDDRIAIIAENYSDLASCVTGVEDPVGAAFFRSAIRSIAGYQRAESKHSRGTSGVEGDDGGQQQADSQAVLMRKVLMSARSRKKRGSGVSNDLGVNMLQSKLILNGHLDAEVKEQTHPEPNDLRSLTVEELMNRCKVLIEDMEKLHFGKSPDDDNTKQNVTSFGNYDPMQAAQSNCPDNAAARCEEIIETALRMSYGSDSHLTGQQSSLDSDTSQGPSGHSAAFLEMHALPVNSQQSFGMGMGVTLQERVVSEGLLLPIQVICSSVRHLKYPQSKVVAFMLLARMGLQCSDEVILHRIVPVLLLGVEDNTNPCVRALAVRSLRAVLQAVRCVNAVEANIFPQYIFPALSAKAARDTEFVVRIAFAESIGRLAETARRFLEQAHLAVQTKTITEKSVVSPNSEGNVDGNNENSAGSTANVAGGDMVCTVDFAYDAKLKALHEQVNRWIRDLVLDSGSSADTSQRGYAAVGLLHSSAHDPRRASMVMQHALSAGSAVKRVLLVDVMRLCLFFGQEATMDILLRYIVTFLNDSDWELRYAFCAKIGAVCAFVGPAVATEFILPCLENALADVEDRVVVRAAQCIHSLLAMGMFTKGLTVDAVTSVLPLLINPCVAIREAALALVHAALVQLGPVDSLVLICPLLRPFCKYEIGTGLCLTVCRTDRSSSSSGEVNECLRRAIRGPISRSAYRAALVERLERGENSSSQYVSSVNNLGAVSRDTAKLSSAIMQISASQIDSDSTGEINNIRVPANELNSDFGLDPSAIRGFEADSMSTKQTAPNGGDNNPISQVTLSTVEATGTSSAVSSNNSNAFPIITDLEDVDKLQLIDEYLRRATEEIKQKTTLSRLLMSQSQFNTGATGYGGSISVAGGAAGSLGTSYEGVTMNSNASARRRMAPLSLARANHFSSTDSLMEVSSAAILDYGAQSLFIPHQKFGLHLFQPYNQGEGKRVSVSELLSAPKNTQKLRQAFGIVTSHSDLASFGGGAAGAAGSAEQWEAQLNSFGVGDAPNAGNAVATRQNAQPRRTLLRSERNIGGTGGGQAAEGASNASNLPSVPLAMTQSHAFGSSVVYDAKALARRIRALNVPQLPPEMGSLVQPDDKKFNVYTDAFNVSAGGPGAVADNASKSSWRPRENVLVASLLEHSHAVNSVAVAADQTFFATASSDKTVKIWRIRGLDSTAFPRSAYTYVGHRGSVLATCVIENSHSVASCSEDGAVQVWRVDHSPPQRAAGATADGDGGASGGVSSLATGNARLAGRVSVAEVRALHDNEGPVVAVNHFNGDICSVLTYITQQGGVHGHDLRAGGDAFKYSLRPELGYLTSMTVAPDRNWVCVGTSRGYVSLWDIRYNLMAKLWRHSSHSNIYRLASCKAMPRSLQQSAAMQSPGGNPPGNRDFALQGTEGAYLFIAAGVNEAAVFGVPEGGEAFKCFRAVPLSSASAPLQGLPMLEHVELPRHPLAPIQAAYGSFNNINSAYSIGDGDPVFRAIMGRISHTGTSYLVTAGSDALIRYWDFSSPAKCFTVSGLLPAQPRPVLSSPNVVPSAGSMTEGTTGTGVYGKLFMSHDSALPSAEAILQAQLPQREGRGAQLPQQGYKDAILDLKSTDLPIRLMIAASRDGSVKLWR